MTIYNLVFNHLDIFGGSTWLILNVSMKHELEYL